MTIEVPQMPDPEKFKDDQGALRPAYHDALAAWKTVALEIVAQRAARPEHLTWLQLTMTERETLIDVVRMANGEPIVVLLNNKVAASLLTKLRGEPI